MKKKGLNSLDLVSSSFVKFIEFDFIFQPYPYSSWNRCSSHQSCRTCGPSVDCHDKIDLVIISKAIPLSTFLVSFSSPKLGLRKVLFASYLSSPSALYVRQRPTNQRVPQTSGEEPLIETQVMLSWRLEELILNGVPINDKTLDTVSAYLASDMSDSIRVLQMDQCNLNGSHVALLMRTMTRVPSEGRNIELHVSANRLEKGVGEIVKAIEENHTPAHLVVRMIEFTKEDHFKQLLQALCTNTTIRSLDISKASLPYDAAPKSCHALRKMFAINDTLEDLDISGEQAHLEVTRSGISLNQALTGLKNNKALKLLRIEY
jgi:hypothetical protein